MSYECVCETYDGEACSFQSQRWQRARKVHTCDECRDEIKPGERYEVFAGMSDGEFFSTKTCAFCAAERERLEQVCRKIGAPPPVLGDLACWVVAEIRGEL